MLTHRHRLKDRHVVVELPDLVTQRSHDDRGILGRAGHEMQHAGVGFYRPINERLGIFAQRPDLGVGGHTHYLVLGAIFSPGPKAFSDRIAVGP